MWTWGQLQRFVRHGDSSQMVHADRVRQAELDRRRKHGLGEPTDDDVIDISGIDFDLTPLAMGLQQPLAGSDDSHFHPIDPLPGYVHMGGGTHTWDAPQHATPTSTPEPTTHHTVDVSSHATTYADTAHTSFDSGTSTSFDSGSAPSVDTGGV